MSFSFNRDRISELKGDSQDNSNNPTNRRHIPDDDAFGPRRTPIGFGMPSSEKAIATPRYLPSHETSAGDQLHELKSPPLIDISTMAAFFEQVDHIKTEIAAVKSNVAGIQSLHESALAAINNSQTRTFASQLVTLKAKTQKQNHNIKKQIQCK
ncbi:hypothetical protein [Absidia glauca]|uniref:Uncharacterized protein n=1 Tax=Absidia glauca TaxID=4829 RepID=A0A163LTU2_ABSGL|nr:hypothetical protein [Absidia glauca]